MKFCKHRADAGREGGRLPREMKIFNVIVVALASFYVARLREHINLHIYTHMHTYTYTNEGAGNDITLWHSLPGRRKGLEL